MTLPALMRLQLTCPLAARLLTAVAAGITSIAGFPTWDSGRGRGRIAGVEPSVVFAADRSDDIGDLARKVDEMAAGLERIELARRRWLAGLTHGRHTPLPVLRGEIEALTDGVRPFDTAAIASLRDDVRYLTVLVDDLHMLARGGTVRKPREST